MNIPFQDCAVDLVCKSPLIVSFFTKDGRYAGCLDCTGTSMTAVEEKALLEALQALPQYIGNDSHHYQSSLFDDWDEDF